MTLTLEESTERPTDEQPPLDPTEYGDVEGATKEAPYGYTKSGRIRSKPLGSSTRKGSMPASESQAKAAAAILASGNAMLGAGLYSFGFLASAQEVEAGNERFEQMAYDALLADPAMCKKILSLGSSSAKVQLLVAYGMLASRVAPAAITELKERKAMREAEESGYATETES